MKQLSRDSWLAIGLFVILVLITIVAASQQTREQIAPPLASFSSAPGGARALRLWLDELGYPISDEPVGVFHPPEEAAIMLMLEPVVQITQDDWQVIDAWVENGGTLVLAGDQFNTLLAARHYNFHLTYFDNPTATLTIHVPLMVSPLLTNLMHVQAQAYFETNRTDFVVHLATETGPVVLSFEQGSGRVILSSTPFPFSNAGLKQAGNSDLALNIVTAGSRPGLIWFDEWHHGLRANQAEIVGPGDWLRYTPTGRSLLYVAVIIFVALILRGRRFGRPVTLSQDLSRRAPLEYITAMANLSRRAGHRSAVLDQYRRRLKRSLGQRYRLDPALPDAIYLSQLAQLNPHLDIGALRSLLARLAQKQVNESEMIQLAAEAAAWLKES